ARAAGPGPAREVALSQGAAAAPELAARAAGAAPHLLRRAAAAAGPGVQLPGGAQSRWRVNEIGAAGRASLSRRVARGALGVSAWSNAAMPSASEAVHEGPCSRPDHSGMPSTEGVEHDDIRRIGAALGVLTGRQAPKIEAFVF